MTDAAFGILIGRGRISVFRYRRGMQMPRPEVAARIEAVTGGAVPPEAHFRARMRYLTGLRAADPMEGVA